MKVLIITYYWVPAGGSGVQRWLKFVKYLRDYGIEPVVFTVDNPNYPIIDETLKTDVPKGIELVKNPIFEPNNLLSKVKKKGSKTSAGFLNPNPGKFEKWMQYIRANYFIPDARMFWVNSSVKKLKKYLYKHNIDAIITTGPPHSVHLIGLKLKQQLKIKWIADFRDPWTAIDYFHQLPLTNKAKAKHFELEAQVVSNANKVLVVGKTMKTNYLHLNEKIEVLTNGYDTSQLEENEQTLDVKFSITHIGLMNADRNPVVLWEALEELCNENEEFKSDLKIKLIGKVANEVKVSLENKDFKNIVYVDYVPHNEVKKYQKASQILLLAVNKVPSAKGIITGKIFEYLQAKRPIIAIGPEDGDLAEILEKTNSGKIADFTNKTLVKEVLLQWYKLYKKGELSSNSTNIEHYHRKSLTEELSKIIKTTVNS